MSNGFRWAAAGLSMHVHKKVMMDFEKKIDSHLTKDVKACFVNFDETKRSRTIYSGKDTWSRDAWL